MGEVWNAAIHRRFSLLRVRNIRRFHRFHRFGFAVVLARRVRQFWRTDPAAISTEGLLDAEETFGPRRWLGQETGHNRTVAESRTVI